MSHLPRHSCPSLSPMNAIASLGTSPRLRLAPALALALSLAFGPRSVAQTPPQANAAPAAPAATATPQPAPREIVVAGPVKTSAAQTNAPPRRLRVQFDGLP
jgi:hypothetical protein